MIDYGEQELTLVSFRLQVHQHILIDLPIILYN